MNLWVHKPCLILKITKKKKNNQINKHLKLVFKSFDQGSKTLNKTRRDLKDKNCVISQGKDRTTTLLEGKLTD